MMPILKRYKHDQRFFSRGDDDHEILQNDA
jgi:hypothetical protein